MILQATDFGKDFIWGTASSAYQTEGAYNVDGKGLSIWDVFSKTSGKTKGSAEKGCDFYNRYLQDIILMHYLNIRNFRFSIAWTRILPDGTGRINRDGIDYYNRLIDFCLEMGIEPWITLYHWDLPQALELKGGWTNRNIIHWFEEYVQICLHHFGDRVKHWMVLNEPMVFTGVGYFLGIHAPGKKGLSNFLPALHHAVLCQGNGIRMIQAQKGMQAGTTFSCSPVHAFSNNVQHTEAATMVDALLNRLFLEPLIGMGYPIKSINLLRQLETFVKQGDEQLMHCIPDFIGIQNYTKEVVKYNLFMPYIKAQLIKAHERNVPITAMNWEIYPQGIYEMLKQFAAYPQIKNIIVSENGAAFHDTLINESVHDPDRISFYQSYLQEVIRAKNEGVPVNGYFNWSFIDNYEWAEGFEKRFGLIYVDYPTGKRIVKSSGYWFREFLKPTIAKVSAKGNSIFAA